MAFFDCYSYCDDLPASRRTYRPPHPRVGEYVPLIDMTRKSTRIKREYVLERPIERGWGGGGIVAYHNQYVEYKRIVVSLSLTAAHV